MVLRALVTLALIAGCNQSLFDNNVGGSGGGLDGGGSGSDDAQMVASSCPAGCIGDAAADIDGSRDGWRYLEDARNRTWAAMSAGNGGYVGAVAPNAIETCAANGGAPGCVALPGALLVTTAGATSGADPALELTVTTRQVVQLSARVYVPNGQPEQTLRLYRNSREDSLVTATALPGQLLERAITVDALAGDRFLLAIAPTAMGAEQVAVHFYVNATGEVFPKACSLALDFAAAMGNTVANACGTVATFRDYDLNNPDDIPPTLAAGPFSELGMAADIPLTQYYTVPDIVQRSGDTTTQMWIRHDAFDPSYSYNAHFFSDIDLDSTGGIDINVFETNSGTRGLGVYTCDTATQTTFTLNGVDVAYPNDANWHFVRVVHTNGQVRICVDGTRVGSFVVPAGDLQGTYPPYLGKDVRWTPAGAFVDGGLDDVRLLSVALPCDP